MAANFPFRTGSQKRKLFAYHRNLFPRYLTIRLWAQDFYEVIVDEAEGRINYHLIEIESE